jgi:nicotinate-nucleotide pyrophosphorylase (carboxylating)
MTIEDIIKNALDEDIGFGDITTDKLAIDDKIFTADFVAKQNGILAGVFLIDKIFKIVDDKVKTIIKKSDGDNVEKGEIFATISGKSSSILKAERVILNFIQRLSGIATLTNNFVEKIKGYDVKILDTRKTTPLLRELEKYAVRIGGGYNHRFGLYDMVMLKENHIRSVGSISEAITRIKQNDVTHKIEVEVTNLAELDEAVKAKADRAMLDNMTIEDMIIAVKKYKGIIELEASGNVTLDTVKQIAATGVDFISSGSLTHSFKSLDISLLFRR